MLNDDVLLDKAAHFTIDFFMDVINSTPPIYNIILITII